MLTTLGSYELRPSGDLCSNSKGFTICYLFRLGKGLVSESNFIHSYPQKNVQNYYPQLFNLNISKSGFEILKSFLRYATFMSFSMVSILQYLELIPISS